MTEILKTARSSYGDWTGTAAADEHQTTGHRTPYEVVGLDPDEWWIIGFDFQGSDLTSKDGLYVYAVRKDSMGITNWDAIQLHGEANGSVPVTSFLVHGVAPVELISESFNQFQVQLRTRNVGHHLDIVARDDLNYDAETNTVIPRPVPEPGALAALREARRQE
ncbi:hypothetical protein ASG92_12875 [Arthrobacter sp. Soil736]|uniref:hypothetical protein n=1 Tax=Arthrobacter sp. Soil736 TaxID=1736395 RepID=UPI0006F603F0|nr:hypothetical protein [Arthrobacter sp. Soil736]KRE44555.1 hypothetical protein ASG92_12875 [Arthrobacter sp. Soil736]